MNKPSDDLDLPPVDDIHRWAAWREHVDASANDTDEDAIQSLLFESATPLQIEFYYDPVWERGRDTPVGRAIPAPASPEGWTDQRQLLEHRCQLSHELFYLPEQVPVPSLIWTPVDVGGTEHEPTCITLHPALPLKGTEAIRQQLRQSAERLRLEAAQLLLKATEREALCEEAIEMPEGSMVPTTVRAPTDSPAPPGDGRP